MNTTKFPRIYAKYKGDFLRWSNVIEDHFGGLIPWGHVFCLSMIPSKTPKIPLFF
jgi:hypothetical protein